MANNNLPIVRLATAFEAMAAAQTRQADALERTAAANEKLAQAYADAFSQLDAAMKKLEPILDRAVLEAQPGEHVEHVEGESIEPTKKKPHGKH